MSILLFLITLIHFLVICFVVLVPFFGSNYLLLLHSFVVPFIMFHWIINNNTCFLTLVEHQIRKQMNGGQDIDPNDCITARIINPIYDFSANNTDSSTSIYIVTTILWLIGLCRIYIKYKCGEINSLMSFMKI